jgi:mercuric ion binding protein
MKRFIAFALLIFSSFCLFAQDKDIATGHYRVDGNCEQCKKRIEDAAYIKGVKKADWNVTTHDLTVIYRPSKTTPGAILNSIARAGHDNEGAKAPDEVYSKLPACCAYRTTDK